VTARLDRDLELGADAVGGGDEDRIAIACGLEIEEGAEAAEPRVAAASRGRARQRLDRFDERIPGVDVDAGILVALAVSVVYGVLPGDEL